MRCALSAGVIDSCDSFDWLCSTGRGTTRPFELVGAPFMLNGTITRALNAQVCSRLIGWLCEQCRSGVVRCSALLSAPPVCLCGALPHTASRTPALMAVSVVLRVCRSELLCVVCLLLAERARRGVARRVLHPDVRPL